MRFAVRDLLKLRHAEFRNGELLEGRHITGVTTDSRSAKVGDLFFALRGEHFDGHAFIVDAIGRGAVAVVVDAAHASDSFPPVPLIVVEDTVKTFGELARLYRQRFSIPVLAIAGSNGKTTTKEMVTKVLQKKHSVLSTEGNLNNQIGVPQTLFRLEKRHEIAVVEIGTNHPGEIAYLCDILMPTHGLVTNIGTEHLEFFKSIDGVAAEEGALFEYLSGSKDSVAFVNADDRRVSAKARAVRRKITYGFSGRSPDVAGRSVRLNATGCARFQFQRKPIRKGMPVQLAIPGRHQAANALAAVTIGLAFRVPSRDICRAVEEFRPASKRMEVLDLDGILVLNDTYNANPDSMIAALCTLADMKVTGKRIAVLGDMLELGEVESEEHARVGKEISRLNIEYLLTYGRRARHIGSGAKAPFAVHYDQKNMLAEYLAELLSPGDAVLVKGSRGMKMEDIVTFLVERLRKKVATAR